MSEVRKKRKRLKKTKEKTIMYGDTLIYILIHSAFSVMIFFSVALGMGLFLGKSLFTGDILIDMQFYIDIVFLSFIAGVTGRALAIIVMHIVVQKTLKMVLRSGKEYKLTHGAFLLIISIFGMITFFMNTPNSNYIFVLLVLLFLAGNRFDNASLVFITASLISSFLWIISALQIVEVFIFTENTITTLILSYFIIKTSIYILSKILVDMLL